LPSICESLGSILNGGKKKLIEHPLCAAHVLGTGDKAVKETDAIPALRKESK
jgi:hypothetical protein